MRLSPSVSRCLIVPMVVAALLLLPGAQPVSASSTVVANEAEYRAALTALSTDTSGPHTITLSDDITLTEGTDPTYTGSQALTIDGAGHTIDATSSSRALFAYPTPAPVTLEAIAIANGDGGGEGGAVWADGPVTVTDSVISGSHSTAAGSAVGSRATVTLSRSTVTGNVGGGAVYSWTAVVLVDSTVVGNQGGGVSAGSSVTATNSTIVGNTSTGLGGGIYADNTATLDHVTLVGNSAPSAANVVATVVSPRASVIAGAAGGGGNCDRPAVSRGYNWTDSTSCGLNADTDIIDVGGDPLLTSLADHGGVTATRYPQFGSPLRDVIPAAFCTAGVDQRGITRPDPAGVACDIGAVEAVVPPTVDLVSPADGALFTPGQLVTADYSCASPVGGSGLVACLGDRANGEPIDTTPGIHEFTVVATERSDDGTAVTHTYRVGSLRPDARIQRGTGPRRGNGIYNDLAAQTVSGSAAAGDRVTYFVSVQNDGSVLDSLTLRGQPGTNGFTIAYRSADNRPITSQVVAGTYTTDPLSPGAVDWIRAIVTVRSAAPTGARLARTVTTRSISEPSFSDGVRFITTRRR